MLVGLLAMAGVLATSPSASAAAGSADTGRGSRSAGDHAITILAQVCQDSDQPDGAYGCFLDQHNGNDDAISACDNPDLRGWAHVTIWEEHSYGWTHEATEKDGADQYCDVNEEFNIGDGNQFHIQVCVQYETGGPLYGCRSKFGYE
jgi:hypothetical protein